MEQIAIGEVARRAGVNASTLRFYERTGIIPRATRVNGQRRYDAKLVRLIEVARFAQSVGFSLEEVRLLFSVPGERQVTRRWKALATEKIRELDESIARAKRMKRVIEEGLSCGCIRAEDCAPRGPSSAPAPSARR